MALVVVLHRVEDYEVFRGLYDSAVSLLKAAGVTAESVHRMADDPDNVLVMHEFDTMDQAREFFTSPLFLEVAGEMGVLEPIRIEYFE